MKALPMEEHHDAYFAWKAEGHTGAWCWHVDAHLDVGRQGLWPQRLQKLEPCRSFEEATSKGLTGNSYLPWGGLTCGNYLYPAIREGIVGKLTWVIPPGLPQGDYLTWAREHVNSWFGMTIREYSGLREERGRISGTILGIPFEMGTIQALGIPKEPVLLDLDIDYFLDEDGSQWGDAAQFAQDIQELDSLCTTVAYSVVGGYTPTELRSLAAPFVEGSVEGYCASPLDEATVLMRCHRFEEAEAAFRPLLEQHPIVAPFNLGRCYRDTKRPQEALEIWARTMEAPGLAADGKAYLGAGCAELCVALERPKEALDHILAAKNLVPEDYRYVWTEALAREALGDIKRATRLIRRALKMAGDEQFGLKILWVLSRLYRKQGKAELAKMTLRQLKQADVGGQFAKHTMLVR